MQLVEFIRHPHKQEPYVLKQGKTCTVEVNGRLIKCIIQDILCKTALIGEFDTPLGARWETELTLRLIER